MCDQSNIHLNLDGSAMLPSSVGKKICEVYENTMTPNEMGKFSMSMDHRTFDQPQSPISSKQYAKMMKLMKRWDMVHQNERTETVWIDFRNAKGIRKIPQNIIHDLKYLSLWKLLLICYN